MHYGNSRRFEEAILGRCSGGPYLSYRSFNRSIAELLENGGEPHPKTRLGTLLFFGVSEQLKKVGVNPNGLRLQSARESRADIHHFVDCFFYLPSIPHYLVTIDLFNLDSEVCALLKDRWDCTDENFFQTHLFSYKMGAAEFSKKTGKQVEHWDRLFGCFDFHSETGRPENHLVLTPYYTENRLRRKSFAKLVADYFIRAVKEMDSQNSAQLSH